MKFDSSAPPLLPTPQQLTELHDLLVAATELHRVYASLEGHPRVVGSPRSVELFATFVEQMEHDVSTLDEQLETLMSLAKKPSKHPTEETPEAAAIAQLLGMDDPFPFKIAPDVAPVDTEKSVFETVRRAFQVEDFFQEQLGSCLDWARVRQHMRLEMQLKMIGLAADQRLILLEDRYGYARSKSVLFQGLRRQTTRFLSALNGEKRTDIDH